ncbi:MULTISPECIES: hypothetical protein [unclassified Coleofasciculus]|uniref:hypothetical protein n=1 Tax=Cyanophyceae TaxID=3028117 RepID=UPI0016866603|nr:MULTISPECIES: hypothetical protein [unclassified Coleofasciculus]MBD1840504.1 hypothetical protein [Coleofasciculus sp. FACHB-501]MBD1898516.1 hypothetical protein [Coleofasciculus sp. FACHB-125]
MEPQIMTWAFRQRLQQVDWVKVVVSWKSLGIENRHRSLEGCCKCNQHTSFEVADD